MGKTKKYWKAPLIFALSFIMFFLLSNAIEIDFDFVVNFYFIKNILNGLIPYKDMNIIVTPLWHYMAAPFFRLFGASFDSLVLFGSFIASSLLTISVSLFNKSSKNRIMRITFMLTIISTLLFILMPNYNSTFLLFPLIILYVESFNDNLSRPKALAIGVLLGLSFLTKQTYGIILCGAYGFYLFVCILKEKNKYEIRKLIFTILGFVFVILIFLVYLFCNNNFYDFIDICFGGLLEFTNNSYCSWQAISYLVITNILVAIFCLIIYKKTSEKKYLLYSIFDIFFVALAFPLVNRYHLIIANFIPIITLFLVLEKYYDMIQYDLSKKMLKLILVVWLGLLGIYIPVVSITHTKEMKLNRSDNYSVLGKLCLDYEFDYIDRLKQVNTYIKEKQLCGYHVIIASADASAYFMLTDECNNKLDVITYGNLGFNGVDRILDALSKLDNPLILKNEFGYINHQEPIEVEEFVVNNYTQIDKIQGLRVFALKNN